MKKSKMLSALLLALGLGVVAGSAQASSVGQVLAAYGRFQLEDDNAEHIINGDGNTTETLLEVGDNLSGIISFLTIKKLGGGGGQTIMDGTTNSSLSAVFQIQVTSRLQTFEADDTVNPFDVDLYTYTFGSNAAFGTSVGTAGAMVAFYESNSLLDTTACGGSIALCTAAAMTGTKVLALGFTGDADEGWKSYNSPEETDLSLFEPSNTFGGFNYNLGTLYSTVGDFYEDQVAFTQSSQGFEDGKVQWTGSGTIQGGNGYAPFTSSSDAQLQAHRIPEPASLSLLGLALVGLGAMRRRSKA